MKIWADVPQRKNFICIIRTCKQINFQERNNLYIKLSLLICESRSPTCQPPVPLSMKLFKCANLTSHHWSHCTKPQNCWNSPTQWTHLDAANVVRIRNDTKSILTSIQLDCPYH